MRMGCAVGAIVITTAACGSSAAAPATTAGPAHPAAAQCGPRSAKTLAVNHQARVYSTQGGVYGCATGGSRSYLLAGNSLRPGQPRIGKLALAGTAVAYGETMTGVDTASAQVTVRRLDDGRTLRSLAAMHQAVGPESFQSVDSVVVKSNGAVAWIATARSIIRHSTEVEVDRADRTGRSTLDIGSAIASTSLRLSGSSLSWRHAGAIRTARLA
jgi:hypothetical protein